MKRWTWPILIAGILILTACGSSSSEDSTQSVGSSYYIENKGSDTLVNLALAWAERYQEEYPDIQISVTGGGSGTGFTALINGTIDIANASRQIKDLEIEQAESAGFEPHEIIVANDAIGVIVNPENPVSELTLDQVSRIYKGEINNWSEVGGEDRPIVRLSRETNSGTHVYFLETVIRLGDEEDTDIFSADTLLLPSSEGIISEVSDNPNAIGYDGLGYITDDVKTVALASKEGRAYILPSAATVIDGTYPVSRSLYMYTRGEPEGIIKDYLEWILSSEAQEIVTDLGFVPILD
ncbi:phosphate ABC transporter substrate-binding protein [Pelolinea submarina]|uniref:Phosphate-binding protein n=1 Tax=Pelolinea submarina TaxID=913107 RepID=A0A347ZVN5_9CHLR|nr:phosphate ABC transporter substrate-binding protein [Pelolinea submarina]REG07061.1 phosphate ABC transporter substrate-binding protein (PhoT family) [Pelolinea submarina]BBB49366.1 phosphate transport system substrate-binding protein [Pelolinea submarina]